MDNAILCIKVQMPIASDDGRHCQWLLLMLWIRLSTRPLSSHPAFTNTNTNKKNTNMNTGHVVTTTNPDPSLHIRRDRLQTKHLLITWPWPRTNAWKVQIIQTGIFSKEDTGRQQVQKWSQRKGDDQQTYLLTLLSLCFSNISSVSCSGWKTGQSWKILNW